MASKAKDNFHQGTITSPEEWVRRLDVLAGTSRLIPAIERGPNETRACAKRREREADALPVMRRHPCDRERAERNKGVREASGARSLLFSRDAACLAHCPYAHASSRPRISTNRIRRIPCQRAGGDQRWHGRQRLPARC